MTGRFQPLPVARLAAEYRSGASTPTKVVREIAARIAAEGERPVWISTFSAAQLEQRAASLESDPRAAGLPLYGIPFAVKDNIDVAGLATTAGCPAFAYRPERSAFVVEQLEKAGAIVIGKTNLDQFATGLVGVRSPYGACTNVFDNRYISGGSSSGSAVAVASGLVSFALGTDTAGSGRVPAACNGLIGVKPTRGALSMSGVVPACRSLDCVSIFAATTGDAAAVAKVATRFDPTDPFSRFPAPGDTAAPWATGAFRFGVPPRAQLEFFGDTEAAHLFDAAVERLRSVGGERVEVDWTPFREAAQLLYSGPWVAERLASIGGFLESHASDVHPVVASIIRGAGRYSATDTYRALYELEALKRTASQAWRQMDVLLLPTMGAIYTIDAVQADPIRLNSNLGHYTNFVNLMDLAAVAAPAGFRSNRLPFGVTFIGKAHTDDGLLNLAARMLSEPTPSAAPPGCTPVAVLGAHLSGQPLNHELTSRGARLVRTCRTAPGYRFYHLNDTTPPKPGLVREPGFDGPGIEVEVWAVPDDSFGGFVAGVPAPLGIGTATLEDGSAVKCFICEPFSVAGSREITHFGGWRGYIASLSQSK
ncbi:MAG: allophanate hydrolase [Bryobacteraceae bacterium]